MALAFLAQIPLLGANSSIALAQSGALLSLEGAVRKAVSWHPAIDEAIGRYKQQAEEINIARSGFYPSIGSGVNMDYDNAGRWQPQLSLSASQMIYDFGKVASSVDVATAGAEVSHAEVLLAVDQLIRDTAYAVIETQRYQALLDAARDQLTGVQDISNLVQQRSAGGASTRSDQVQAQVRVQAAQSSVLQVEGQLARWQSNLAALTGSAGVPGVTMDVPAWLFRACDIGEPDWGQVPALMQAQAQQDEAAAQLGQSRVAGFPTLSLEAGAGIDPTQITSFDPDFKVGLTFSGKLYDGGASGARAEAAGYAMNAANAALEKARIDVSQTITDARTQTANMLKMLDTMILRDQLVQETRDLYRQQYFELGTRTLLDLLDAEQELHQGRYDTVNTRQDIRRLRLDCMFNSGKARASFALQGQVVSGVAL